MTDAKETDLGFSQDFDQPIRYMDRTQRWYDTLGYGNAYQWAHFTEVPFAPLGKPLKDARIALLTTSAPYRADKGDQSANAPYNAGAKFYDIYSGDTAADHDQRISHVGIDRKRLKEDQNSWFPLPALRRAVAAGRIGGLTSRFHGVPTNRSQRHTIVVDAPEIVRRCREDGADAVVLVPNCPVCHQSMSLMARALEAAGIPTVIMGAAKDITEHCGVPRFVFSDLPLGNAAGLPFDVASQDAVLELALHTLETAVSPRTTVQTRLKWPEPAEWHRDYLNLEALTPEEIAAHRAKNDQIKQVAQSVRDTTLAEKQSA